ncbi:MAG: putative bifunctional diguanylate cyclase/phosphodiesterase [Roseiarcus sp.]
MITKSSRRVWRQRLAFALNQVDSLFKLSTENPELMRSQLKALTRQIPLLYFILVVNTNALAWTHFGVAPLGLTIIFPAFLTIVCVIRTWVWITSPAESVSDATLIRRLKTTIAVTGGLGVCFLVWSLSLYPYGDAYAQGHVAFYIGITVVSCIFCLMHLRPAALLLTGIVIVPFTIFFLSTGHPAFIAIALNMLLVAVAMTYILLTYSRDFANMIDFQKELIKTHEAETERERANAEDQRRAHQDMLKHAGRFEAALNNMLQGLCMFDSEDRLIVCNDHFRKMYALPEELAREGVHWRDIVAHRVKTFRYRDLDYDDFLDQHNVADPKVYAKTTTRELGDGRTILARHQPIAEGGWVATYEDITERRLTEERLSHMARHDALTGLGNRLLLEERLEQAVARLARGEQFAVLCLDLEHFKETNDALGHAIGDELLRGIATRFRACVFGSDTIARTGGDEFAIVQTGIVDPEETGELAQQILHVLEAPFVVEGHQIVIGASIGIACAPRDESAGVRLMRLADIALHRAKSEGRQGYRFFEAAMDSELQTRRRLTTDLRSALADEQFELYFQPINIAKTRSIRSFEALVRWRHPVRGMISPEEFIRLAEETNLIAPLGEWVLRAACKEASRWPADVRVSVNLSACQFKTGHLTKTIGRALAETGLSPRRLELEITESVLLEGSIDNLAMLHELRSWGIKIAMDDFGTGYSSLSYLRRFPFDKIKIDQSFVQNIDGRDASEIVRAIASIGQTLGMATTAEGVESEHQLQKVIAYGCAEVQGYLFSRPVPASDVAGLLDRFNRTRQAA